MVYKHTSATPNWLYRRPSLDVDQLPEIKKELLQVFEFSKQLCLVPYTSTFMYLEVEQIKDCPVLLQELDRLQLKQNFIALAFVSVVDDREFPAHVDNGNEIALNIPLLNCSGSFLVWYDGKISETPVPEYAVGHPLAGEACVGDSESLVEIGRIESDQPYWINVNVLHRPVTMHDNFRLIASLRFHPIPIDEHGELWPHLNKD